MSRIRRAARVFVLLSLSASVPSCRGARVEATRPVTTVSAAAAASEVRAAADGWRRAYEAKDAAGIVSFYADNGLAMYPRPQPTVGRAVNLAVWTESYARPNAAHPLTTDSVVVAASGDVAYTVGRWRVTYDRADTTPVNVGGQWIAVWRRSAVGWRIAVLSAHTHQPAPPIP